MDLFGELRTAIEATRLDHAQASWVVWALVRMDRERRAAGMQKVHHELGAVQTNNASLNLWIAWAVEGSDGLVTHLQAKGPEGLPDARAVAAWWLAAWIWRCAIAESAHPATDGLHVNLGLGDGALLSQCLETSVPAPAQTPRHVIIERVGGLPRGVFNTHAALRGYPGLPEHLPDPFA